MSAAAAAAPRSMARAARVARTNAVRLNAATPPIAAIIAVDPTCSPHTRVNEHTHTHGLPAPPSRTAEPTAAGDGAAAWVKLTRRVALRCPIALASEPPMPFQRFVAAPTREPTLTTLATFTAKPFFAGLGATVNRSAKLTLPCLLFPAPPAPPPLPAAVSCASCVSLASAELTPPCAAERCCVRGV